MPTAEPTPRCGSAEAWLPTDTMTIGGSMEMDAKELTDMPTSCSSTLRVVTMVIPEGKVPTTVRNSCALTNEPLSDMRCSLELLARPWSSISRDPAVPAP